MKTNILITQYMMLLRKHGESLSKYCYTVNLFIDYNNQLNKFKYNEVLINKKKTLTRLNNHIYFILPTSQNGFCLFYYCCENKN